MCALRAQSTVELEPDMQHITLASHTSLALAHVVLAPQAEFELLEGMQQQNTSGQGDTGKRGITKEQNTGTTE